MLIIGQYLRSGKHNNKSVYLFDLAVGPRDHCRVKSNILYKLQKKGILNQGCWYLMIGLPEYYGKRSIKPIVVWNIQKRVKGIKRNLYRLSY